MRSPSGWNSARGSVTTSSRAGATAPLALHTVAQARERILRRLKDPPDGVAFDQLLPDESPDPAEPSRRARLRPSGRAATCEADWNSPSKVMW